MAKKPIQVEIRDDGLEKELHSKKYATKIEAGLLLDVDITQKELIDMVIKNAGIQVENALADQVATDFLKEYRDIWMAEIRVGMRQYTTENKDKIMKTVFKKATKLVEERLEDMLDSMY